MKYSNKYSKVVNCLKKIDSWNYFLNKVSTRKEEMSIRRDRDNQISWQQFSHQLRTADERPTLDYYYRNQREEYDESFDFPAPNPRHIQPTEINRPTSKKRIQPKQNIEEIQTNTASSTHQRIKKAKTRAERRAVEEPNDETPTEPSLSKHKERRSSYWIQRDDKRRNAARTLKVKFLEE